MRVFWALIAILIAGAALAMVISRRGGTSTSPQATPPAQLPSASPSLDQGAPAKPLDAPSPVPARAAATPVAPPADTIAPAKLMQPSAPLPIQQQQARPADPPLAAPALATPKPGHGGGATVAAPVVIAVEHIPEADGPVTRAPAKIGEYEVSPGRFEEKDGALLVDGRFTIRGEGTKEKPYRVPWELLVSAKDAFDPAGKRLRIPERVAMLHEKHVTLTGYVAFPMMVQRPMELLSMLNQWDGCCIGVPPTPYDAVEVKLLKQVTGDARYALAGNVTGLFKVEPYVVKNAKADWLVGLYTMTQGDFSPSDFGAGSDS